MVSGVHSTQSRAKTGDVGHQKFSLSSSQQLKICKIVEGWALEEKVKRQVSAAVCHNELDAKLLEELERTDRKLAQKIATLLQPSDLGSGTKGLVQCNLL